MKQTTPRIVKMDVDKAIALSKDRNNNAFFMFFVNKRTFVPSRKNVTRIGNPEVDENAITKIYNGYERVITTGINEIVLAAENGCGNTYSAALSFLNICFDTFFNKRQGIYSERENEILKKLLSLKKSRSEYSAFISGMTNEEMIERYSNGLKCVDMTLQNGEQHIFYTTSSYDKIANCLSGLLDVRVSGISKTEAERMEIPYVTSTKVAEYIKTVNLVNSVVRRPIFA